MPLVTRGGETNRIGQEAEPLISCEERASSTLGWLIVIAFSGSVITGIMVGGMAKSVLLGIVTGVAICLYVLVRGKADVSNGFWLRVYRDSVVWRSGRGEFCVPIDSVARFVDDRHMGYRVELVNGKSLWMPICGSIYYPAYKLLFELYPGLFDCRPVEHGLLM